MGFSTLGDFLTAQEVSNYLKLSVLTIYKYIKERKLEAVNFGGYYRIPKSSLLKFIENHRIKGADNEA